MKRLRLYLLISFFTLISCKSDLKEKESSEAQKGNEKSSQSKIFEKIGSEHSKINFANSIKENLETLENLFSFDYFYNGAGVGVEDLNNDGLLDIFFCGNQVDNKLYINQGNLVFKDISEEAGINVGKKWSNGVTFVDINDDGLKDIYVSQGGPNQRLSRKNLLFINNGPSPDSGQISFTEKASDYGLMDMGITTQSAFFDYDNDGDLDCVVMNENEIYGVDPINFYNLVSQNVEAQHFNSSRLYRNDKGKFVDVTKNAGLERPIFGLGLCVSDINKDGFLDIYIASDYYIPDVLYVNNGNGTFSDRIKDYTQQISYYGMGIDIADINKDSREDIFVLDMSSSDHIRSKTLMASMNTGRFNYLVNEAGFHYQYMYNSLQLNIGNNKFNNISQLTNMANTDWSWSVLMTDYDHDEDADVFITNGYRRYALDNDLQNRVYEIQKKYGKNVPVEIKKQLYESMPSEKLANVLYQNNGGLSFKTNAQEWGLEDYSFSNGAAQGDLDNDGDLDLVVNNMDEKAFLYKNLTSERNAGNYLRVKTVGKTSEPFAKIKVSYDGKSQFIEQKRVRGYMSAQENTSHFGLGNTTNIDTVTVEWLDGRIEKKTNVKPNTTVRFDIENAKNPIHANEHDEPIFVQMEAQNFGLDFVHRENFYDDFETEILLPYKQSTFGPYISKGDVNGDGLEDIFVGGASGQAASLYLQESDGFKKQKTDAFEEDMGFEDMESIFFDLDGDKDLDLYVVSGGSEFAENSSFYQDRIYLNDGSGVFTRHKEPVLQSFPKSGKTVAIIDFDKDGDSDLLVGNRTIPKRYPQYSPSVLYENDNGVLKNVTAEIVPELENFGVVNSILATDFDNDGWQDFIAVGEWTPIGFFKNRNGKLNLISDSDSDVLKSKGWWFSIDETDINNDGLKDYIVGNVGLNLKFKASKKKPFKIYSNDFDGNGTNDVVLSKQYKGEYVPVRGRECSSQQMPFIKEKFGTYSEFANATLVDIYGEELSKSYEEEVTEFQSLLLLNQGNGSFESSPLPIQAQQFPIMGSVFADINKDGFSDCIVAGNIYETEVETPRLDAISGEILLSNGKDGFTVMDHITSGLYLQGNTKDIVLLGFKNGPLLLQSRNDDRLNAYKFGRN